jgi:hypothetical protein
MTRSIKSGFLLSAAVAAVSLLGSTGSAQAQNQVGSGGHALDASNRVGSGGINTPTNTGSTNGYSNSTNVFTGNVSGLNYFHGNTNGIFDPNTVDANTESGASDNLNRFSAPANSSAPPIGGGNNQAYYNASQTINTPKNFVPTANGQGYIPAPKLNPLTIDADSRLGNVNLNNQPENLLPAPGEVDMAGPVDPSGSQSLYTMSPLYGVRKNDSSNAADSFFLSQYSNYGQGSNADRSRLDPTALRRMQDELNSSALPNDQQNPTDKTNPNSTGGNTPVNAPGAVNIGQNDKLQGASIGSDQLSGQALSSAIGAAPLDNGLDNGQGTQNRLLVPAARQSAQIQALEKKYAGQKLTDVQSSDFYNQQQLLLKKENSAKPGVKPDTNAAPNTTGAKPSVPFGSGPIESIDANAPQKPEPKPTPVLTGTETNTAGNTATDNQPYVITSLATGIKAKGLADLLKTAEDQMRGGKFSQAIDTYNTAEQVAPNNPFVPLGRGFAELGRSYYAKADSDIARAIKLEPAILAGQYDLKGFVGDERVQFIQKDLSDISTSEKNGRAPLLLAFIAHNTGDDATAARELDQAAARGGYTALVNQMRDAWNLKAGPAAAK